MISSSPPTDTTTDHALTDFRVTPRCSSSPTRIVGGDGAVEREPDRFGRLHRSRQGPWGAGDAGTVRLRPEKRELLPGNLLRCVPPGRPFRSLGDHRSGTDGFTPVEHADRPPGQIRQQISQHDDEQVSRYHWQPGLPA